MGVMEKIKEIEAEMARTQKNKATNYHLGTLKAKLAKLRNELLIEQGGGGGGGRKFCACINFFVVFLLNDFNWNSPLKFKYVSLFGAMPCTPPKTKQLVKALM